VAENKTIHWAGNTSWETQAKNASALELFKVGSKQRGLLAAS